METDAIIFNFETFEEAFSVHKEIFRRIKDNGYLTYAEVIYDIIGDKKPKDGIKQEYTIYGWNNLFGVTVDYAKTKDGVYWFITMPDMILVNKNKFKIERNSKK